MTQQPGPAPRLDTYGAVDLSRLAAPAAPRTNGATASAGGAYVIDVTDTTFEAEVLARSQTVPVLVDMWASWCDPCKQLSPILERLVEADAGRWLLAKVDVDANQELAAAFGVQSIPAVFAVIGGQAMPLFQGALPEADVRRVVDEVLRVAEANGIDGTVSAPEPDDTEGPPGAGDEGVEPTEEVVRVDGPLVAALAMLRTTDLAAAATSYQQTLAAAPADHEAQIGLARVKLLQRIDGVSPARARAAAEADAADLPAQETAADVDVAEGRAADGFARLVAAIRLAPVDDRERLRAHLVSLFEVVGTGDPAVPPARTALANALF